jgi:RND family efflux transporter MFP subunit
MRELHAKGGISQQDMDSQEMQLKVAKMGLETARRATLILAPEAGVVTEIKFKVGQTPGQGAQFATIAKLNKVILKLNITSKDIGFFKKGASAKVTVADETFTGKVTLIPLAANPTTHFFPVEITFDNKAKKLLPGMYVTAELDARQVEGIVVPAEAIVYRNGINVIWTVDAEGKALRKIVKLGVQTKNDVQMDMVGDPASIDQIRPGVRVYHFKFGFGDVQSVEGLAPDTKAVVSFDTVGTKTLLLKFAKFKIIG